ncbi:hypothetical protein FHG87_008743 [Trinorchestia longiramus]|nr:hypothetical protein FHG87_008743 [Trinorchestia longiramus]
MSKFSQVRRPVFGLSSICEEELPQSSLFVQDTVENIRDYYEETFVVNPDASRGSSYQLRLDPNSNVEISEKVNTTSLNADTSARNMIKILPGPTASVQSVDTVDCRKKLNSQNKESDIISRTSNSPLNTNGIIFEFGEMEGSSESAFEEDCNAFVHTFNSSAFAVNSFPSSNPNLDTGDTCNRTEVPFTSPGKEIILIQENDVLKRKSSKQRFAPAVPLKPKHLQARLPVYQTEPHPLHVVTHCGHEELFSNGFIYQESHVTLGRHFLVSAPSELESVSALNSAVIVPKNFRNDPTFLHANECKFAPDGFSNECDESSGNFQAENVFERYSSCGTHRRSGNEENGELISNSYNGYREYEFSIDNCGKEVINSALEALDKDSKIAKEKYSNWKIEEQNKIPLRGCVSLGDSMEYKKSKKKSKSLIKPIVKKVKSSMYKAFSEKDLRAAVEEDKFPGLAGQESVGSRTGKSLRHTDSVEDLCGAERRPDTLEHGSGLAGQPASVIATSLPHINQLAGSPDSIDHLHSSSLHLHKQPLYINPNLHHHATSLSNSHHNSAVDVSTKRDNSADGSVVSRDDASAEETYTKFGKRPDKSHKSKLKRRSPYYRTNKDAPSSPWKLRNENVLRVSAQIYRSVPINIDFLTIHLDFQFPIIFGETPAPGVLMCSLDSSVRTAAVENGCDHHSSDNAIYRNEKERSSDKSCGIGASPSLEGFERLVGQSLSWWKHGWLRSTMDPPKWEDDDGRSTSGHHRRALSWSCRRSGKISPTSRKGHCRDGGADTALGGQDVEHDDGHRRVPTRRASSKKEGKCGGRAEVRLEGRTSTKSGGSWWNRKMKGSKSRESSPTREGTSFEVAVPTTHPCVAEESNLGLTLDVKSSASAQEFSSLFLSTDAAHNKEKRSFFKEFKSHSKECKTPTKEKRSNFKKYQSRSKELRKLFREYRSVSKEEQSSHTFETRRSLTPTFDSNHLTTSYLTKSCSLRSSSSERPSSPGLNFVRPPSPCCFLTTLGSSLRSHKKSPSSTCTSLVTSPVSSSFRVDSAILWSSAQIFSPPSLVIDIDGRSKSLTHIDTLGGDGPANAAMLGGSDDGGVEGGVPGSEGHHQLGVPHDNSHRRKKLSLHSKVSSSEYILVVSESLGGGDPVDEIIPASRGTTLREALERLGYDVSGASIVIEDTTTSVHPSTETSVLGGKTLRYRGRDVSRSPVRTRSAGPSPGQLSSRKQSNTRAAQGWFHRSAASTEDNSPLVDERANGGPASQDGSTKASAKVSKPNNRWSIFLHKRDSNPGLPARKQIRSPVDQAGDSRPSW